MACGYKNHLVVKIELFVVYYIAVQFRLSINSIFVHANSRWSHILL